jgi:hypothetical protein
VGYLSIVIFHLKDICQRLNIVPKTMNKAGHCFLEIARVHQGTGNKHTRYIGRLPFQGLGWEFAIIDGFGAATLVEN